MNPVCNEDLCIYVILANEFLLINFFPIVVVFVVIQIFGVDIQGCVHMLLRDGEDAIKTEANQSNNHAI